jgi:hypothetical protein
VKIRQACTSSDSETNRESSPFAAHLGSQGHDMRGPWVYHVP